MLMHRKKTMGLDRSHPLQAWLKHHETSPHLAPSGEKENRKDKKHLVLRRTARRQITAGVRLKEKPRTEMAGESWLMAYTPEGISMEKMRTVPNF